MKQEEKTQTERTQEGTECIDEIVSEAKKVSKQPAKISPALSQALSDPWYIWINTGRYPRSYSGGGGYDEGGSRH